MKRPFVFADQHHMGLYNSLKLFFEDRLGGTLFRPIGNEWLDSGYWKIAEIYNNHPATVAQYLGIPLNDVTDEDMIHKIWEPQHEFWQNGLTLQKFYEIKPEIVVASVPEHIESFKRLASEVGAKMIYQIGNAWPIEAGLAPNIMASAKIANVPNNINYVEYHQEFSTDIFIPDVSVKPKKNIYSFVNCFNTADIYKNDWKLFEEIELEMPDWSFKAFGGSCRDGVANGQLGVASKMREAKFIWQTKWGGDGFGHIIYNSASVGRPLIVKKQYYIGKMGEELMIDGETCITIDGLTNQEIINKIRYFSEPDRYVDLCNRAYINFLDKVDFDKEEIKLREFIKNLL